MRLLISPVKRAVSYFLKMNTFMYIYTFSVLLEIGKKIYGVSSNIHFLK